MSDVYPDLTWQDGMIEPPRTNGRIREHRLVAAEMLGRSLMEHETVHHRDEVKSNNDPSNLVVFRSNADHMRYHNSGIMIDMGDGTHTSPDNGPFVCGCGKLMTRHAQVCLECHKKDKASKIPSKAELEKAVWQTPTTKLAVEYGVSDVAVAKWCKKYGIKKPPRGYWRKQQALEV